MSDDKPPVPRVLEAEAQAAIEREDPIRLAQNATLEELARLGAAEDVLEKRHHRKKRSGRLSIVAQALVGYVALAGFFANAYQNWNSKKQAEERARTDEERWAKEFKRAQDADKYRAFFETSSLATDSKNSDKRLVGYALLKEFVDDKDYNAKATFMLEESLALELRDDKGPGLDEPHRAAVVAILGALSHTSECQALERASKTVFKVAQRRKAGESDEAEAAEVFELYVLRLVGRAASVCTTAKEFREVRAPLVDVLIKVPTLGVLKTRVDGPGANTRIAEILRDACQEEMDGGNNLCSDEPSGYLRLCADLGKDPAERGGCAVFAKAPTSSVPKGIQGP